jgi:hypothetical protein
MPLGRPTFKVSLPCGFLRINHRPERYARGNFLRSPGPGFRSVLICIPVRNSYSAAAGSWLWPVATVGGLLGFLGETPKQAR